MWLHADSLCVVNVEEIRVQNCLDDACNNRDWIVEARYVEDVAVDPVRNIESPVGAKRKKVVRCDCLCFSSSL
jgi:hypothetical protein